MLSTARIVAFVAAVHPDRARHFYVETLGLPRLADEPFALVFDANGVMLRVQKVAALASAPHTVLGWNVPDVRAAVEALAAKGVVIERFGDMPQDALGIWTSPGGASVAWFKDPDGNLLSLTQP